MTAVGAPHRCNARGMARYRQPVVDSSADSAPLQRRFFLALMPGDQQQDPVAGGNCPLKAKVDRLPCPIQAVAVQIQCPIGINPAGAQPPVPAAIER